MDPLLIKQIIFEGPKSNKILKVIHYQHPINTPINELKKLERSYTTEEAQYINDKINNQNDILRMRSESKNFIDRNKAIAKININHKISNLKIKTEKCIDENSILLSEKTGVDETPCIKQSTIKKQIKDE